MNFGKGTCAWPDDRGHSVDAQRESVFLLPPYT